MNRRFPKGKTSQESPTEGVVTALLWGLILLGCMLFLLWTFTPFWDLFIPHFSWLP